MFCSVLEFGRAGGKSGYFGILSTVEGNSNWPSEFRQLASPPHPCPTPAPNPSLRQWQPEKRHWGITQAPQQHWGWSSAGAWEALLVMCPGLSWLDGTLSLRTGLGSQLPLSSGNVGTELELGVDSIS